MSKDIDDIALYDAEKAADDGSRIPGEAAHAILDGAHPIKAWRGYRVFTRFRMTTHPVEFDMYYSL